MDRMRLIEVRHVQAGHRKIPVELFRNESGSVAARCLFGSADMPIIDGPTPERAMAAVEDLMEGLLLAREGRSP